jgi:hypothetical protein
MNRRDWLRLSLSGTAALIMGTEAPALQPRKIPPKGFRTGLAAIDDYAGCWDRGDLVTIMGNPGVGKTVMGCQIAGINAKDGHKVVALIDGEELQWAMCGVRTKPLPDCVENETQWRLILESIDADLIILDGSIPYMFAKEYKDGGLYQHRMRIIGTLMRHCHERNCSAVLVSQTRRTPPAGQRLYIANSGQPSLISFWSSRIFSIKKLPGFDLVDVTMIKNRHGFNHGSFFYKHAITPYGVRMEPVKTLKLEALDEFTTSD